MCTLGTKKINGYFYLFKNRDLESPKNTKIKRENGKIRKLLLVDEKGHCEGINEYGIGIIGAMLQPFPRVRYKKLSQITRRILDQDNLIDALRIIENNKISANIILSDGNKSLIVEKTPYEFAVTKVRKQGVITNLSIKLNKKNGSKLKSVRDWARTRYKRAKKIVNKIHSFEDIKKFLSDKENYPDKSICSGGPWWIATRCSFIYDLKNKKIFFCKARPDKGNFKEYKL